MKLQKGSPVRQPLCFRSLAALLLCLAAAGLGGGCGQDNPDAVVFAVGGAPSELLFWQEVVDAFTAETGIPVELLRQPADTSQQRQSLVIALKARMKNPDVFLMDVVWVGLFAASKWLAPLGRDLSPAPFFERVVRLVDFHEGRLVALPVYVDAGMLYYRRDLLHRYGVARPPATWSGLVDAAVRIQAGMRRHNPRFYGFVWQGAQYEGLMTTFLEFAGPEGGFVFREGKVLLNTPANRRALSFMHDLIWKYEISPPSTFTAMQEEEVRTYFQEGDALFERNWPYAWSLHQAPESPVQGGTGVAPLPAWQGSATTSTLGGWHIGMSAYSDRKAAALKFIRFVTSRPVQKQMALRLGWNPGRRDLYDDPEVLAAAPHLQTLERVLQQAVPRPLLPFYAQVSQIVQLRINGALAGRYPAEHALEAAQTEISALLERYRDE